MIGQAGVAQNISKAASKAGAGAAATMGSLILGQIGFGVGLDTLTNVALGGMPVEKAAGLAVRDAAVLAVAPGAYWASMIFNQAIRPLAGAYLNAGPKIADQYNKTRREMSKPTFSYQDTQPAMTMRQAAIQAIQGSKLNARNALGGEAALMHRGFNKRV
jgi:hypothetical protein